MELVVVVVDSGFIKVIWLLLLNDVMMDCMACSSFWISSLNCWLNESILMYVMLVRLIRMTAMIRNLKTFLVIEKVLNFIELMCVVYCMLFGI